MSVSTEVVRIKNSKVARAPICVSSDIELNLDSDEISITGKKGTLTLKKSPFVRLDASEGYVKISPNDPSKAARALSGTYAALIKNMVQGVSFGIQKTVKLIGVGYRAKLSGRKLELTLGFSHPVFFNLPDGIDVEISDQTTIIIKGIDKQLVGQVAAEIRSHRPPENYKGKGIRYLDEKIYIKDTKK